jgi:ABC-type transporter Mla subunit MlaD
MIVKSSVYGLEVGSPVFYIGHQVGTVRSIALADDRVIVQIAFHEDFTINASTYARLEIRDFQLRKVVMVYTPLLDAAPIERGVRSGGFVLTLQESSAIDNIPEELLKVIRRVESILKEIEGIMQGTQDKTRRALANADKASEDLRIAAKQLSQMLNKFSKTRLWRWLAG